MALTVGELVAYLDLDSNPFTKNLSAAMRDAESSGKRMEQVGGKMTKGVTLPLLAAGGAAVKLGNDFETSFARMVGLAGVPAGEIDGLKDSILDLAGETAVAPQELADALYDAASAGLTSSQALEAVQVAAKGASAGMGTTGDIVGLVASATASYGSEAIDAAKATDILTATIRAGRADPAELAGTLGRVLPVASQLGIEFDQVGGAVAYLSNVFGDTNRTVTALQGFMVKLVSPTQQGRDALAEMGTSVEELQAAIDQDGLMGALELLREKGFADNQQALRALFDDIEGFQGALALLNDESGTLVDTMGEVEGSSGALGEAFDAAQTDGKKITQALVDLQVAAIRAGEILGPFVSTVASGISTVADAFSALPGPAQAVILAFAGIMAAVGPITSVAGKLVSNWGKISSAFETMAIKGMYAKDALGKIGGGGVSAAGGLGKMGTALGALGLVGAAIGLAQLASSIDRTSVNVDELATNLANLGAAEERQMQQALLAASRFGDLESIVRKTADANVIAADRLLEQAEAAGITGDELADLKAIVDGKREADRQGAKDQAEYAAEMQEAVPPAEDLTGALEDQQSAAEKLAEAFDELLQAVMAQFDADIAYRRSLDSTEDAMAALAETQKEHGKDSEEYQRALLDVEDAMLGQAASAVDLAVKQAEANGKTLDGKAQSEIYRAELVRLRDSMAPGSPMWNALDAHIRKIDEIPDSAQTKVTADLSEAERAIREFTQRSFVARIQTQLDNPYARVGGFQVRDSGGPVYGPKGSPQMVLAHAGEVVLPTHRMGLGEALQHTLGISTVQPAGAPVAGGGRVVNIGEMVVQTQDSPRQWLDEGLWRVAG